CGIEACPQWSSGAFWVETNEAEYAKARRGYNACMSENDSTPRAFISYAWTSEDHRDRVLALATRLVGDGVDVVIDQWNLRPGHDAFQFMERMVTDLTITKVVIVCDRAYVEKSISRSGGVGTEAQIISPEIYTANASQERFVVVSTELDDKNVPCRPAFYKSRLSIPMIDETSAETAYEELLRWLYGRPLRVRPPLGAPPSYITSNAEPLAMNNVVALNPARLQPPTRATSEAIGDLFFRAAIEDVTKLGIAAGATDEEVEAEVMRLIGDLRRHTESISDYFLDHVNSIKVPQGCETVCSFFEQLSELCDARKYSSTGYVHGWALDHYRLFLEEVFCRFIAAAIRKNRFDVVQFLMNRRYFIKRFAQSSSLKSSSYGRFSYTLPSLDARNARLSLGRASLQSDLLKQRCEGSQILFQEYMQADFVLYLNNCFAGLSTGAERWWPSSLLYAHAQNEPFEIFVRAESTSYCDRLAAMFGMTSAQRLSDMVGSLPDSAGYFPTFGHWTLNPLYLANAGNLARFP
ncbi:MAG: SEFIR domain-containing protein, partial [Pseudomonadota bacterium]